MNFEELVEKRRSYKEFKDKDVEIEKLQKIFELTTEAPTAFNLQAYSFKVLDSEEAIKAAVESTVPGNEWVGDADKIVLLVGDERIDTNLDKVLEDMLEKDYLDEETAEEYRERISGYGDRDKLFKTGWLNRNTMIPATFFMLACEDQGLGTCPVRGFSNEKISESLELEEWERPGLMLPIGYPEEDERPQKWRRKGKEVFEVI
ncbi:MAG: nitroreductase family protein [Candidatus Nanohaloarchaea archaeon]